VSAGFVLIPVIGVLESVAVGKAFGKVFLYHTNQADFIQVANKTVTHFISILLSIFIV